MLSLSGISSGRSLQFDTSDIFPCCSKRIFCRFCRSAVRSSLKNADEHLQASTRHCNTSEQCSRKCLSRNASKQDRLECDLERTHWGWRCRRYDGRGTISEKSVAFVTSQRADSRAVCLSTLFIKELFGIIWVIKYEAYRRGFPISLLIVPHSTLVNFLVFRLGNDSLRHRQNSLSPSKSGLEGGERKKQYYSFRKRNTVL